ncbi:MAG: penicillin-binding protein 2 [Clostridia bacterium]|nr:penicillin-binding protein 2 [Clostridia bacterium]
MRKRLWAWVCALSVLMLGISVRLWSLTEGELRTVSLSQSARRETIASVRGTIYDRYKQPLVNRSGVYAVFVPPWDRCVETIHRTVDPQTFQAVLRNTQNGQRSLILSEYALPASEGIVQVQVPVRYDKAALACHVIGYVDGEGHGVCGVERQMDDILTTYGGFADAVYRVDALGRVAMDSALSLEYDEDCGVGGVQLTLDAQVQEIAQRVASSSLARGALLIARAEDMQMLASVSMPMFDPTCVEAALECSSAPLLDRTQINYNCGSVFKILTAAAALESGIPAAKRYVCTGACTFDGVTIGCHAVEGHGELDMYEAFAQSCNGYFMQLAQDVGADPIRCMAVRGGFDRGLEVLDGALTACALLPSAQNLSAEAALANFSIGQGELMATPYHILALTGSIVNDGVWSCPSLYLGEVNRKGETVSRACSNATVRLFSPETASCLRTMLEQTVQKGTGTAAKPSSKSAGGKTGTAETGWYDRGEEVVQSWFTGYYPVEHPQYVITVLSENGGTDGRSASPLFKAVCDELEQCGLVENHT